ncbi:MAG: polymer-forming cytoskeletal protein [Holophagales bacterium]|nr:polymer-forming cytoskeletal protein [Holophagales bacterium]
MFKSSSAQGELNGFLDAGSHMSGELRFEDTFRIDGNLSGSIVSDGDLVVGERGEVEGEIEVRRVFVSGTVRGTLRATERVELTSTAKVFADLFAPVLTVEEGAFFEGRCSMSHQGSRPAAEKRSEKIAQMPAASG